MMDFEMPGYVRAILRKLEENGYSAYLTGGCVRDMLMSRTVHDWDISTSALSGEVEALFAKTIATGVKYGTVTVVLDGGKAEVTTFRSEGAYLGRRRPAGVKFISDLETDLSRRDFTVNAMAMSLEGRIADPLGGRRDIAARLIRCVGKAEDRFSEDALRMFRALRFSAQLGFEIEDGTMSAVRKCAPYTASLSAERVSAETEKILLSDRSGLIGDAVNLGLFSGRLLPGEIPPVVFSALSDLPRDREMRWSAFCAALCSSDLAESPDTFLRSMRLDSGAVRHCGRGVTLALAGLPTDRGRIKRLLSEFGVRAVLCGASADQILYGGHAAARVEEIISSGECWSLKDLAVSGADLISSGLSPGAELGKTLRALLLHVIDNPGDNSRAVLLKLAEAIRT